MNFTVAILSGRTYTRSLVMASVVVLSFLFSPVALWANCADYGQVPGAVGVLDLPDTPCDLVIDGNHLYLCASEHLHVVDISDPLAPFITGSVEAYCYARDVATAGHHAYVAIDDSGLEIVDISNPEEPWIVGHVDLPGGAQDVAVEGNYAFIATGPARTLEIVDVSDPAAPWIAGSIDLEEVAKCVVISNGIAYASATYTGVLLVDITNPTSPEILGIAETPSFAKDVVVHGDYAYATHNGGFAVFDVSDPTDPAIIGNLWMDDPGDLTIQGIYAFVSDGVNGIKVIDISHPNSPQIVAAIDLPPRTSGVAVAGDFAYAATDALIIVDVSDPTFAVMPIGEVDTGQNTHGVAMTETYAYVADAVMGLMVIDITDPTDPSVVGTLPTPGDAFDVAVSGQYAYVADGNEGDLLVIDLSIPMIPRIVASAPMVWAYAVTVRGDYVYVADYSSHSLRIVDVSDPLTPLFAGGVKIAEPGEDSGPRSVSVSGDYAYLIDCSGELFVVSIADPGNPAVVGHLEDVGENGVVAVGDYAYVSGMSVIDISNPENPTLVSSIPAGGYYLSVVGNYAYLAAGDRGMQVIDISNPSDPVMIGFIDTPDLAFRVSANNEYAFIADETGGLIIAPIQCAPAAIGPTDITRTPRLLLPSYPHPIRGETTIRFDLPAEGPTRIRITGPAGRQIRQLLNTPSEAGNHRLPWDGRDDLGRPVASGVYFLRLDWKDRTDAQRLILLK